VHVTICTLGGRPVFRRREVAMAVVDAVRWLRDVRKAKVYAFCVVPDHMHLLMSVRVISRSRSIQGRFRRDATNLGGRLRSAPRRRRRQHQIPTDRLGPMERYRRS
jgi:REP element-mobilizing transposase RayT